MQLTLGTPVRCSDGELGELADLVVDPGRRRVTHLVVRPRHQEALVGPGSRLVPIELAAAEGEPPQITLRCTVAEAGRLEPVEEVAFLRGGAFPVEDPDWDVGVSEVLAMPYYPMGDPVGPSYPTDIEMQYDRIPKHEVEIRRSSLVTSADGHDLGRLEAFILDDEDRVTHFVLERGHLWGRRDVTIPIGAVTKIETDAVTVGLTKDEVKALPAMPVHRW